MIMQRIFDVLFSVLAILIALPLLIPIVILLRLTGEGEVYFLQERVGRNGETFYLYKFATMLKNSPNMDLGSVTVNNDPRILPIGGFLRKTKINELPQLLNVLFGDMSLIGPRPLTVRNFQIYAKKTQNIITKVRPGLSGIGSIVFRDEEAMLKGKNGSLDFYDNVIAPYKGCLEEWFVNNNSLRLYFIAIFVTVWVVIAKKSNLPWVAFRDLPMPPYELSNILNAPNNSDFKER